MKNNDQGAWSCWPWRMVRQCWRMRRRTVAWPLPFAHDAQVLAHEAPVAVYILLFTFLQPPGNGRERGEIRKNGRFRRTLNLVTP
ncbi:hypothetical protein L195_g041450 [Trifolium pratense]|uniref:Uncharacterized protein n=1 Tax=Trifolium pratense TaxID=57577 RepID=A0A2K3M3M9_TRIPR|nr:hypothetical protein L195_g041450 [Trifolium pratense]